MSDFPVRVFLTLGSNIDPAANLVRAVGLVGELGRIVVVSRAWVSAPVGFLDQPDFWNAAALLETTLEPEVLKDRLRGIESRLGRVRDPLNKNAPRPIDLDIAFYGDRILKTDSLKIPDPDITNRWFLAVPLAELDPAFTHPVIRRSLEMLAAGFQEMASARPSHIFFDCR